VCLTSLWGFVGVGGDWEMSIRIVHLNSGQFSSAGHISVGIVTMIIAQKL